MHSIVSRTRVGKVKQGGSIRVLLLASGVAGGRAETVDLLWDMCVLLRHLHPSARSISLWARLMTRNSVADHWISGPLT
jgi:hypothetical protein